MTALNKRDLDARFSALNARCDEIATKYHLAAAPKVIDHLKVKTLEVRPDIGFLIGELNFVWGLLGQVLKAGDAMHRKIQELEAKLAEPKIQVVTAQQLRMLEQAQAAEARKETRR